MSVQYLRDVYNDDGSLHWKAARCQGVLFATTGNGPYFAHAGNTSAWIEEIRNGWRVYVENIHPISRKVRFSNEQTFADYKDDAFEWAVEQMLFQEEK